MAPAGAGAGRPLPASRRAPVDGLEPSDRVACWYHGVEVGGDGQVKSVPAVDSCPMEGKTCVRSYPVQEKAGAVFVWFGDRAPGEADALRLPEELESEEHSHFLCVAHWDCNYATRWTTSWTRCTVPTCTQSRTRWPAARSRP